MSVTSNTPMAGFLRMLISVCLFSGLVISESIVGTDPHVVLEVGTTGILPCRIHRKAYLIQWKRQMTSEHLLVYLDPYFNVGARAGPGYKEGLFNITDDYSLVIKDVKVLNEGLYFCEFSDYLTGKVLRNKTSVSVQGLPDEPFPVIQECTAQDVNNDVCSLNVRSTSNLTCSVRGYYPDIDLFFLHGFEHVPSTEYEEWSNADGTKNKKIRVQVRVSEEPYKCVASGLPGIDGNRSASVIVQVRESPQAYSQGPNVAVIVVPVLLIAVICLLIAVIFKCYLKNRRGRLHNLDSEQNITLVPQGIPIEGPLSKPELWKLVQVAEKNKASGKLRDAIGHLWDTTSSTLHRDDNFYVLLCKWKSEPSSTLQDRQREELYSACRKVGMSDIVRTLEEFVVETSNEVSRVDIDHILWTIRDTSTIIKLVKRLGQDHETVATAREKGRKEVINMARMEILKWQDQNFKMNPVIVLSLQLDALGCEANFFELQKSEKEDIDELEMREICCQISKQHYTHLLKTIQDVHGEELPDKIEGFVDENNESLFQTTRMLRDWLESEDCSNYEKRNKLQKAVEATSKRHLETDAKWPPDDELKVIASFLSPASMGKLCSKLEMKCPRGGTKEEEQRFQVLANWRDDHALTKDLKKKHSDLYNALKDISQEGLIPRTKSQLVYKVELVDLAFQMFVQDLLPFIEALGISAAKLTTYKPTFHLSHMTLGTIGLVCKLFESGERSNSFNLLKEMPLSNVFASGMLALDISYGEVCAIFDGMQRSSYTGKSNLARHDISKSSQYGLYDETTNGVATMLALMAGVGNHSRISTESLAALHHFKLWREQPRLIPFNFRLALAKGLRSMGKESQAYAFLRGDNKKWKIPYDFISNVLLSMDPGQRCILRSLMKDEPLYRFQTSRIQTSSFVFPKEEDWKLPTGQVSRKTRAWVEKWIQKRIESNGKKDGKEIAKKHKEFNDKLVDNGFIDLAREIMIYSEQQLIDAK